MGIKQTGLFGYTLSNLWDTPGIKTMVCCQVVFGVLFCVAEKGQSLKTVIFVPIV